MRIRLIAVLALVLGFVGVRAAPAQTLAASSSAPSSGASFAVAPVFAGVTFAMADPAPALQPPALRLKFNLTDQAAQPVTKRQLAFEYSDGYRFRAKIHRYASFATLPLFALEGYFGQSLYNNPTEGRKSAHLAVATGMGVLFGVNAVTGVWNLLEARKDPNGRTRRMVHGILMLAASGGFVATAATAPESELGEGGQNSERWRRRLAKPAPRNRLYVHRAGRGVLPDNAIWKVGQMPTFLSHWTNAWTALYSDSALLRTTVGFAHIGGLLVAGGSAIAADRATLMAWRRDAASRVAHARVLHGTHRMVVIGLIVVSVSGVLLLAADLDTYLHSWVFWTKMGLVALLLANGSLLVHAGRRAQTGHQRAWTRLGYGSISSLILWFLTTLLGAALPNA